MTRTAPILTLLALLAISAPAFIHTQNIPPPPPPPPAVDETEDAPDPAALAAAKLLETISQSVIALDATGDRTSEAIADSTVTLTLAEMQDSGKFGVLCPSGGEPLRTFVQSLTRSLSLTGQVLKPSCTGTGHASDPFKIVFHLHREGGSTGLFRESPLLFSPTVEAPDNTSSEREGVLFDRATEQLPQPQADAPEKVEPLLLDPRHTQTSHAVMSLPQGWTPHELPEPVHSDSPFATFDLVISFADGKLVTDQKLVIKQEKIEAIDRPAFDKWVKSSEVNASGPEIALDSTMYYPPEAFSGKTDDEKKAADLIHESFGEIQAKTFAKAEAALNQAEALDPGHELLHENKGRLAAARGDYEKALVEYQRELRAFPNVPVVMESIAQAQRHLGRNDDAIATLQRWILADPNTFFPVIDLMDLYHGMGRDDLACATGDLAMNTLNADGRRSAKFLSIYGHEQALAGQYQAAKATYDRLLDYTTDIQFVNDAAYFLSQHGLSLDRAEETVRASLTQFDDDSDDEIPHMYKMDDKQQTSLLFSAWDTLGWILFNKGNHAEAESYIRAAWHGHQDPAIGRHLGELLVAQEKPVEALDAFHLALATVPEKDQEKAAKDPDIIAIHAAIARLEKEGHASTVTDAAAALTKLRTLDPVPAGTLRGDTEYEVVITASTIFATWNEKKQESGRELIGTMKVPPGYFPTGSTARMTKTAKLSCTTVCSLTFLP